ncbi:MAG: DUF3108 domain-containing protein [Deltaproteobacteria bacterium]|nr:DUF3108 domain-containing protein [Deltaproteobacteria bacterium]
MNAIYSLLLISLLASPSNAEGVIELPEMKVENENPRLLFQDVKGPTPNLSDKKRYPFELGEKYEYKVYHRTFMSNVLIGKCLMETGDLKKIDGRWAVSFKLAAISADWYKWVLVIKDSAEGYFDLESNETLFLEVNKRENKYRSSNQVYFDTKKNTITEKDITEDSPKFKKYQIPDDILDAYSIVYLIRKQDLNTVKEIRYNIYSHGKVYPYYSKVLGKYKINLNGKLYDTFKVQVLTKIVGALEQKGGIFVFFSADERKIPMKIKADVKVGHFVADLIE